ncbi:MAG: hypothetical protein AB7D07_07270 [Desulfovibrionaceae bacterium]
MEEPKTIEEAMFQAFDVIGCIAEDIEEVHANIIPFSELQSRWIGATIENFAQLILKGKLSAYDEAVLHEQSDGRFKGLAFKIVPAESRKMPYLTKRGVIIEKCPLGFVRSVDDLPRLVFLLRDVEALEAQAGMEWLTQYRSGTERRENKGARGQAVDGAPTLHANSSDIQAWEKAIATVTRPAPKKRLTIWLRRHYEKLAVVQADYPTRNIQRDVREAAKTDVPSLRKQFPELPDRPPIPKATV